MTESFLKSASNNFDHDWQLNKTYGKKYASQKKEGFNYVESTCDLESQGEYFIYSSFTFGHSVLDKSRVASSLIEQIS